MIRTFLNGAFANTAFCILAPDGKTRLSRSGRSPSALFGRRGGSVGEPEAVIKKLKKMSSDYRVKDSMAEATLQDFHTTRQAINVASGDQRLLVLTVAGDDERSSTVETLQTVLNDSDVVSRFHHDFVESQSDASWEELVAGEQSETGYFVIQADSFGLKGEVVTELPLSSSPQELKKALLKANRSFASAEQRKVYREHVKKGRREGIHFEGGMPYGEDKDGDGVIDERRGRRQRR